MKTVQAVSLGCAKNAVDLQLRLGALLKSGYVFSNDPESADLLIVNTCSFIASARAEAEAEIARALALKAQGKVGRVLVTGCYPERYPALAAAFPGVDGWEGVPQDWTAQRCPGFRLTGKAFAYLKIAEGCAHRCAYCAIPSIRGRYRSRPFRAILKEARELLRTGCRELNIVAQDPMLWRDGKRRLPELLWALDRLPGDFWIRVLYSYPSEITAEFLAWMRSSRHAVRYIDVPLQHTVPEVLAKMNRRGAIPFSLAAAETLRALVPGVTLRTTIMTGFPGETQARFNRLLSDLKRMQFDHLGVFAYSPEAGTAGARLRGRVSARKAEERAAIVAACAEDIWRARAAREVGRTFRALVVAPGIARLESQAPEVDGVVRLRRSAAASPRAKVGSFVKVRLVQAAQFDFEATLSVNCKSDESIF